MSKWKIYTPEGVQDILFEECYIKRNIEDRIRKYFRSCAYFEIESPTLEFYDTFSAESDLIPQETMFKFYDQQGRILVLRPEITIPVARIAATKYRETAYPQKIFYIGNAFKYNELGGGKQKEFTQAGVEILGANTPEADAEVIVSAINSVKACGLENFQIDIGQVNFFKGLMEETGLSEHDTEQMRVLIDKKDFLGIEELVEHHNISKNLKEIIYSLPGLFGSTDVIEKVKRLTNNERSLAALDNLNQILEIIIDYGLEKYVSIDLGMVQNLNYYTGIIFRGFTYGIGFPILSGGRYDNLVEKFGKDCPATGFSLGVNMVMTALERQKAALEKPGIDTLILYNQGGRKTAFKVCEELRHQGLSIEIDITKGSLEEISEYAKAKNIGGVILVANEENIEIHDLRTGDAVYTSMAELLQKGS